MDADEVRRVLGVFIFYGKTRMSVKVKNFEKEYKEKGAYHFKAHGFYKWWLEDNYRMLCACVSHECRTILDLGCGDGRLQHFMPSFVKTIFGVDLSLTALKFALKQNKYVLALSDIKALPFEKNTFDAVVSSVSLQYLTENDLLKAFHDVYEVLKPDGSFVFSYRNTDAYIPESTDVALPLSWIKKILSEHGFTKIHVYGICALNPRLLVSFSTKPLLSLLSRLYYLLSRYAYFFPGRSYHYVVHCVKKER